MLDNIFKKAIPPQLMCYLNAKLAITFFNLTGGPPLSSKLRKWIPSDSELARAHLRTDSYPWT